MAQIDANLLERYQLELNRNPRSRVFAPLAEAYRRMGLIDQALELCRQGVNYHPQFASGRVALGRLFMEKESWEEAEKELKQGAQLSPDNLLAHRLLGRCYTMLKKPQQALKSYKYVLLISPRDEEASRFIERWESMLAKDYDEDFFESTPEERSYNREPASLSKTLSIADALIVRKEWEQARSWLESQNHWGDHPQMKKRLKLLGGPSRSLPKGDPRLRERKILLLRKLLRRIETSSMQAGSSDFERPGR